MKTDTLYIPYDTYRMFKQLLEILVLIILVRPLFYIDRTRSKTTTNAFVVKPVNPCSRHQTYYDRTCVSVNPKIIELSSRLLLSTPFSDLYNDEVVDYDRAKYCVNHFGTCTLAEMESIKEGIHKERMHHLIFGSNDHSPTDDAAATTTLESRLLEEELDIQISLLKEQNSITDVALFPMEDMKEAMVPPMFNTNDGEISSTSELKTTEGIFHKPTPSEVLAFEETVLEENLLEPIAICVAIIGLALVPQLL